MEKLNERYFIVTYAYLLVQRFFPWNFYSYRSGHTTISVDNGKYLNPEETISLIEKDLKNAQDIVITNIIELNQQDYQSWTQTNPS